MMTLDDRIKLFNLDHFTDSDQEIVTEETAKDGQASLSLKVTRRCLALQKADERKVCFLKAQQVA